MMANLIFGANTLTDQITLLYSVLECVKQTAIHFSPPSHKPFSPEGETCKPSHGASQSKHVDRNKSTITLHAGVSLQFIFHLHLRAIPQLGRESHSVLTGQTSSFQITKQNVLTFPERHLFMHPFSVFIFLSENITVSPLGEALELMHLRQLHI